MLVYDKQVGEFNPGVRREFGKVCRCGDGDVTTRYAGEVDADDVSAGLGDQRLQTLAPGQAVWMGTFHRFCARLLRMYADRVGLGENFSILDVDDSRTLLREAIEEAKVQLEMITPDKLAQAISWAKNQLIDPALYPQAGTGIWKAIVERVYPLYQRRLLAANCVDFDDLLMQIGVADIDARVRERVEERLVGA